VVACSFSSSSMRASGRLFLQQQQHQTKWSPVPSAAGASGQVRVACPLSSMRPSGPLFLQQQQHEGKWSPVPSAVTASVARTAQSECLSTAIDKATGTLPPSPLGLLEECPGLLGLCGPLGRSVLS
jgi:hypothetical protein